MAAAATPRIIVVGGGLAGLAAVITAMSALVWAIRRKP